MSGLLEWRWRPRVGRRSVGAARGAERLTDIESAAPSSVDSRVDRKLGATRLAILVASRGNSRRRSHASGGRTKEARQKSSEATEQSAAAPARDGCVGCGSEPTRANRGRRAWSKRRVRRRDDVRSGGGRGAARARTRETPGGGPGKLARSAAARCETRLCRTGREYQCQDPTERPSNRRRGQP